MPPLCTNLKLLNYKGLLYLHIIKCVIFVDRHHNSFLHFFHIIFTQHFRLKNKIIIIFYIIFFVSKITKNKILLISSSLDKHFVIKISDKNKWHFILTEVVYKLWKQIKISIIIIIYQLFER